MLDFATTQSHVDAGMGSYYVRLHMYNTTPSWKEYGSGTARCEVFTDSHFRAALVDTVEVSTSMENNVHQKETFFTFSPEYAQLVFDMMVQAGFKPSPDVVVHDGL